MSKITSWIKEELYPTLYNSIDIAFPEHRFNTYSKGWRSQTYINGTPHESTKDKTVVAKNSPGYIFENGGDSYSLVDYVMNRDNSSFIEAVETLANIVNLSIPKGEIDEESYAKQRNKLNILEDCNSYFIFCLENSSGAEDIRNYLTSRGYSSEDIKAMDLGFIPSQEQLIKYLQSKDHSKELIDEVVKLNAGIGTTHRLTIPYRSGGSIKGFKFRTIGEYKPKYLNSTGLDKNGGFFNLLGIKGDKDLVIVEGELDSLSATAKGVNNVVSTGGSSINKEQVQDAIKRGAKSFTLCFDNEPGKEDRTKKNIDLAIDVIRKEGVDRIFIALLPTLNGAKTDPDSFIRDKGVEAFKDIIKEAGVFYEYSLNQTLSKCKDYDTKEIYKLLDEVVETSSNLSPVDKDIYKNLFLNLELSKKLGITEESLKITIDRLTSTRDGEEQSKSLNTLISKVKDLQSKGDVAKALELMEREVKDVKLKNKATEFSSLFSPIKENELRDRQKLKPESLDSGLSIENEPLLIPSGALSILVAPTSHGKTTFLSNLALNVVEKYPEKDFFVFSYEEDSDSVLISCLNIYLNKELSKNNRTTLKNYFAGKNNVSLGNEKDVFFNNIIGTGRLNIQYTDYGIETLTDAIRYLNKNANIGGIFIDYFQLLNRDKGKNNSRQEELKDICIDLKDLAVETGLPIVLGAQFNREVKLHTHIHATKIGEAGDIERIANLIVGFWNNKFEISGNTKKEEDEITTNSGIYGEVGSDTIYTKILKQRGGQRGQTEIFKFNGNTGKISNDIVIKPF